MGNHKYLIYFFTLVVPEIYGYRTIKTDGGVIIFAQPAEEVDIVCENDVPLARCGFTHPNGTKIFFTNVIPGTPSCKYTTEAVRPDLGVWTCHFWASISPQEETKKTIEVRVEHKFAALKRDVKVEEGQEVSLSCVSTERMVPLTYCDFITPANERIAMDDAIASKHAINQRYFFPRNKSLHRGDCGLTISSATAEDIGTWTCYGWVELERQQFSDTIQLTVEIDDLNDDPLKVSVEAYVCGTLGFLVFFAALVYWKYRYYSTFYGKAWTDVISVSSYETNQRIDDTPLFTINNYLLNT